MKAFVVLALLVIIFMLFASNSLSGLNLTSNTPGSGGSPAQAAPLPPAQFGPTEVVAPPAASAPQVITIQESPTAIPNVVPVTGGCSDPYTVRPGDMLSQIAVTCNTTVAAIRQANPSISDANLIYPGEQLRIPGAAAAQPLPVTGNNNGINSFGLQTTATPKAVVPITGLFPQIAANSGLQVKGIGYPANTPVNVEVGPQNGSFTVVANGVTDANGDITTSIRVPAAADQTTPWVVVVATTSSTPIQAMSKPFTIGPAQ